ncbi:MAG: NAD(P)-dependent oxidoreductase, partial [Gammaproteobacteria bacterium]
MCSDSDYSTCNNIGVIGATGLVGGCLLTMLIQADRKVFAYSRREISSVDAGVEWRRLPSAESIMEPPLHSLIYLAPIWTLPKHFALLEAQSVKRVVALSSTSRFTKYDSSDSSEQDIAL